MKVTQGSIITFHYSIVGDDGHVVETTQGEDPVSCVWGDGDLLVGIERALEGVEVGTKLKLDLPPEDAFGEYDPEGIVSVPREEIPGDEELSAGEWISIFTEPEDPEEGEPEELEARVVSVDDSEVILDLNHPLAGKTVTFELELLDIVPEED